MFDGIRELEPGHYMVFQGTQLRNQRYWSLKRADDLDVSSKETVGMLREKLSAAVHSHLVSDVPIGLFLSGGIDSSSIAALVGTLKPPEFHTFTVSFDAGSHNEAQTAREMARRIGSIHHELVVDYKEAVKNLTRVIKCHDEPFGDAANICIYTMAAFARQHVKVVLCGDGGDEVFGGYLRYQGNLVARKLLPFFPNLGDLSLPPRYQRIVSILEQKDPDRRYATWMLPFVGGLAEFYRFLSPEVFDTRVEEEYFERYKTLFRQAYGRDIVNSMLYTDLHLLLHDTYLKKIDRPTMAHGLEARVPMLDRDLVEFVSRLPGSFKVKPWGLKVGLREAMRGLVPDSTLDGGKKGFGVPFEQWLRTDLKELAEEVLFDPSSGSHGFFQKEYVQDAWVSFLAGRGYYGHLLWYLLIFELWYHEYMK
jgi:asparagine synthase (glutamine-hydrolysing)